jgi:hypothetical protein
MLGFRSLGAKIPQLRCLGPSGAYWGWAAHYWGWAGCLHNEDMCALYLVP